MLLIALFQHLRDSLLYFLLEIVEALLRVCFSNDNLVSDPFVVVNDTALNFHQSIYLV